MAKYIPLSESSVTWASNQSGENIQDLISRAFHNWSNMVTGSDESYGGVYKYDDGSSRMIVAAPEKYLLQAGILALTIGGSDPVWVHGSMEALAEMAELQKNDLAKFPFVGVVKPIERILSNAKHEGVKSLFENERCRQDFEHGMVYHSLHDTGGGQLGPKRVDTMVYRIAPSILEKLSGKKIILRAPTITDTDNMSTLGVILQEQSGIRLNASGYRHSTNHSVTILLPEKIRGDINPKPIDTITLIDSVVAHSLLGI